MNFKVINGKWHLDSDDLAVRLAFSIFIIMQKELPTDSFRRGRNLKKHNYKFKNNNDENTRN